MSWRVVATAMIAIFAILVVSMVTANPLYMATDSISELDSDQSDRVPGADTLADAGVRAYGNLILILSLGTIAWGAWYLLRRELSQNQL